MTDGIIRAVVVDDEPSAREAVVTFLAEADAIEVVGEARNGREAVEVVRSARPDLLFLDVQMPGLDGFEVLEALGDDVPPGVVLVTAHGEYALRAFEVHAVDYVTKPFGRPRFMAAVDRAVQRLAGAQALDVRATLRSLAAGLRLDPDVVSDAQAAVPADDADRSPRAEARIGVRLGSRTVLVDVASIDWVEVDGDLVRLHTEDAVHLLRSTLKEMLQTLGADDFVRIHRGVVVNRNRIRVLQREPDGGGSVVLDSGVSLRVARARWDTLEARLGLRFKG